MTINENKIYIVIWKKIIFQILILNFIEINFFVNLHKI